MIPVFEPVVGDEEIAAVVAALRRGEISGSFGRAIPEFEQGFAAMKSGWKVNIVGAFKLTGLSVPAGIRGK